MRRLNVKLLVYLLVAVVAVVGVTTALWTVNLQRTLEAQLDAANKAREAGNLRDAYEGYRRYLKQEPNNKEAAASLGLVTAELAEEEQTREMMALAYTALEYALRLDPSNVEVRQRLVRYTMFLTRYQDAIQHLEILLQTKKDDGELEADLARCYWVMGQNENAEQTYLLSLEHAPDRVETYLMYTTLLRDRLEKPEEADAIIEKMVEANPESFKAWLAKSQYCHNLNRREEAQAALDKAREISGENVDVLLMSAQMARTNGDFAQCEELLKKCLELHPEEARVYQQLASLALNNNDAEKAMQIINQGLEKLPENTALLVIKADLLVNKGDRDEARKTVDQLRKFRYEPEGLDYLNARLLILDGNNVQASQILESIRPLLARKKELRIQVNMLLARCYERLGQYDLMEDAFNRVLEDDPNNAYVLIRKKYEEVRSGGDVTTIDTSILNGVIPLTEPTRFQIELARQLKETDPAKRDWSACQQVLDEFRVRVKELTEGDDKRQQEKVLTLLESELAAQQGDMDKAIEMVTGLLNQDRMDVSMWIALAGLRDRKEPDTGMASTLAEAEAELGKNVLLYQMMVNLAARPGGDEAVKKILEMEPKVEAMDNKAEQTLLYGNMAELIFANGNYPEAQRLFAKADELAPHPDLRIRIRRFDLAYAAHNDEDMQKLINSIAELMGKDSAEYCYAEASRIVTLIDAKVMERSRTEEAREFIKRAREYRPAWGALARLDAQLDEIEGNVESAIANYELGIDQGEVTKGYVMRLMQLYYLRGDFDKAAKLMDNLKMSDTDGALDPMKSRILVGQGKLEEALALQVQNCERTKSAEEWIFLGQLYEEIGKKEDIPKAEDAYRKAAEFAPQAARAWTTLVAFLVRQGEMEKAEALIAELPQRLPDEREHLVMAACYEMVDKPDEAQLQYAQQLSQNPKSFADQRNLASFYARANKISESQELLQQMLSRADEAEIADLAHLAWARRTLAQILGRTGNYVQLKEALALLDQNARGGVLPAEDVMLKATLLGGRVDRTSRVQAIKLIEELLQARKGGSASATPAEHVLLAQMYDKERSPDSWARCKDHMFTALLNNEQNLVYVTTFIRMLIDHDELTEAAAWLEKLRTMAPTSDMYIDSQARYLAAVDKKDEALALVKTAVPDPIPALPDAVRRVLGASLLLEDISLIKAAQEQLERYIQQRPQEVLMLASFHGRQHNIDDAIAVCQSALGNRTAEEVGRTALLALRQCLDVAKPEHYSLAEQWVMKAKEEMPNSIAVDLMVADLYDLQGKYAEAAAKYEEILAKQDIGEGARITAQNNLAYIQAVKFNNAKDALELVNKALEVGGPLAELLDTKAIILTMLNDTDQALEMLNEALADTPNDAVKLFHLARVHVKANDLEKAQDTLEKARLNGLDIKMLPQLEHDAYKDLLDQLRVQ